MRRAVAALAVLPALWWIGADAPASAAVVATPDRARVSTELGRTFSFATYVADDGSRGSGPVVAHLDVVSLDPAVYVDPEDWSAARTRYLGPIAPGTPRRVSWSVKAVNSGAFAVYVTVVRPDGTGTPVTGPAVRVTVADRQTLDAGGILPLAIGTPLALGLVAALSWRRRMRATAVRG